MAAAWARSEYVTLSWLQKRDHDIAVVHFEKFPPIIWQRLALNAVVIKFQSKVNYKRYK